MSVYSTGNFSGLSLLNNNFTSNDIGVCFALQANVGFISNMNNVVVTGNRFNLSRVGISFNIGNTGSILYSNGVNVSYCRFSDNTGNYQLFMNGTGSVAADYNWWGSNAGPQRNLISGVVVNNYYVMSISTSVSNLGRFVDENLAVSYNFVLNGTNNNANAATRFGHFTVGIMVNGKLWSNIDGRKSAQYNVPLSAVDNTIRATLNSAVSTFNYKALQRPPAPPSKVATTLVVNNLQPLFNKANVITVTARDKNGRLLANKNVGLWVKGVLIGTVKTNSSGVASFRYTFKARDTHGIQAKFTGDTTHSSSNSLTLFLTPKDKTTTTLAKFTAKYNKKATFKATLKNHKNKAMAKRVVKFYANNKYLGQAKTNTKGIATLTKKVTVKGAVNFIARYAGDNTFHNSDVTRKIRVK